MNITFDGVSLQTANIITEVVKHESAPDRDITRLPIARRDGSVYVTNRYGEKVILLRGSLLGSSQSDFEARVDDLKELFRREQKNLIVSWEATTREYVATCLRHNLNREHYNVDWVFWEAEFLVSSGEGSDPSSTAALAATALDITTPDTAAFTMDGSKPGRPTITLKGNNWPTGCLGIELENTDTGEKIQITNNVAWGNDSVITIDAEALTVTHNISSVIETLDFFGTMPNFNIGTNNVQISAGRLLVQGTTEPDISSVGGLAFFSNEVRYAQSFSIPYTNDTFRMIRVPLKKYGTPTGDLTAAIQGDSGGEPNGSAVATFTLAASGITSSFAYYDIDISAFELKANTTYWLVLYGAAFDNSNGLYWGTVPAAYGVPGSITRNSESFGATWSAPDTREMAYQIFYGGLDGSSAAILDITYTKKWL